jgi:heterodisulfide reductase subunit A
LASKKVCVIGAGISGISVAGNLSQAGVEVALIDQNPYPGGKALFYGCKAAESCVHCGVCLAREAVAGLKRGAAGECLFSARPFGFRALPGPAGGFEVDVSSQPNAIDWRSCTECGRCLEACPEKAIEKAPGWKYFVNDRCTACGKCLSACPVGAIALDRKPQRQTVAADGVVLATGFEPFDPAINRKWGFGASTRVVTGTQMERLFFEERHLPEEAATVAFVQCVGSRNIVEGQRHCSRVCCAYALRMAGRLKTEFPDLAIDFYYMDIQRFGKSFEEFWREVQGKINPILSNPISVATDGQGRPVVRYEALPEMACREKSYDVVVLANGIGPGKESEQLADLFDLDLSPAGFLNPAANPHAGVFAAGTCRRPMRIDDCVEDAAAVSRQVLQHLGVRV